MKVHTVNEKDSVNSINPLHNKANAHDPNDFLADEYGHNTLVHR